MAEKSLAQSAMEFLNNLILEKDPRNSILDPLTCIIRLGILSFKDKGTKISVQDNSIKFNNPNIFQGAKRWSMGDNREDLHNLYKPILKTIEWYNLSRPEIKGLLEYSIKGLELLKNSYNSNSIVSHTLNLYTREIQIELEKIEKLQSTEEDSNTESSRKTRRSTNVRNSIFSTLKEEDLNKQNYKFFRGLWNENEIVICYNLLKQMDSTEDREEIDNYIKSIDAILSMKEGKVKNTITEVSTILE